MDDGSRRGLLISPSFHGYEHSIADAFEACGVEIQLSTYPSLDEGVLKRIYYFLLKHTKYTDLESGRQSLRLKRFHDLIEAYNQAVIERVHSGDFDVVIAIKGEFIKSETVRRIGEDVTTILWTYDEISRHPYMNESVPWYDFVYSFDPKDGGSFGDDTTVNYLPLAHDSSVYDRQGKCDKAGIDVSFVGNLRDDRRKELLSEVIKRLDVDVQVWYKAWNWQNPLSYYRYRVRHRSLGQHINNTFVDHATINDIYNRSKVCLNIHKSWKVGGEEPAGINMRTFEIAGSGGFQLVDYVPNIGSVFDVGEEIEVYHDTDEFIEKVEYYVEADDERERIARNGHQRAKAEHTFQHRVDHIVEELSESEQETLGI